MRTRTAAILACCFLVTAAEARAQVAWDSPLLLPPNPEAGTGIYLMDAHRAGIGVLGTWRGPGQGMGLRVGIADGLGDGIAVLGGVDLVGGLAAAGPGFPLDISWIAGIGAGYDNWFLLSVPVGLTVGRSFQAEGILFTPYLSPRLILDGAFGDAPATAEGLDLNLAVDLGFDLAFQPGWTLRFGASMGDRGGLAVGVRF